MLLLFTPFDPLYPQLFDEDMQAKMGEPIQAWCLRNQKHLEHNGLRGEELTKFVEDMTMKKWDEMQGKRMGLDLCDYYHHINPNRLL